MARWTTVLAACKFLRLLTQFSPGIQTMKLQKYQPFRMPNNHKQDTTTVVSSSSKQVVSAPPVIGKWTYFERTKKFNPQIKPLPKCYKSKYVLLMVWSCFKLTLCCQKNKGSHVHKKSTSTSLVPTARQVRWTTVLVAACESLRLLTQFSPGINSNNKVPEKTNLSEH